ncbi:hypothetical protein MLD38_037823 [Melastoma candidum]|uniref:Uncharacterized protein n=1 Tax=Melastoma candidum TaxID=119954 RepID=A0ACB9LNV1_9MYRT|nr:hypothetical protein MLD38_037823 [Melastoma candidum]
MDWTMLKSQDFTRLLATSVLSLATVGDPTDTVYDLFLCRDYVSDDACQSCINNVTTEIHRECPGKEVIIRFDDCLLRY